MAYSDVKPTPRAYVYLQEPIGWLVAGREAGGCVELEYVVCWLSYRPVLSQTLLT